MIVQLLADNFICLEFKQIVDKYLYFSKPKETFLFNGKPLKKFYSCMKGNNWYDYFHSFGNQSLVAKQITPLFNCT